jgi:hypothetical protein
MTAKRDRLFTILARQPRLELNPQQGEPPPPGEGSP